MSQKTNKRPIAVLISDVHYSLKNLELSDKAFRAAIDKAAELGVPLIDAGDLTDDKAIIRAEVANRLIDTMDYAYERRVDVFCLVGNHSLVNQKGKEHALEFLKPYCEVVDSPEMYYFGDTPVCFIPYQVSESDFLSELFCFTKDNLVIAHQGTKGGQMGDYVQDPSAFDPKETRDYRIFLGHYHAHYELENTVSIGNPFTMSFGEANDGPKGFLILYSDGSYTREILDFRWHVVEECSASFVNMVEDWSLYRPQDLLWLKIHGTPSELAQIKKSDLAAKLGRQDFKLDKIPTGADTIQEAPKKASTEAETLDRLIDGMGETAEQKTALKGLWREVLE